jgi:ABC-type lipopolysaccharide export system ATPase subunit
VEQNARAALRATSRAYVLEQGRVVHQGPSAELAQDPNVIAHYLGQAESASAAKAGSPSGHSIQEVTP